MTLPKITKKQQEILTLLQRFRFLNRIQIQALLKHKNKNTSNIWLQDLNQKEYIERIWSSKTGDNMKPAIYYLELNGIRCLKTLGYTPAELNNLRHEKIKSENFIAKQLLIADIWLFLEKRSDGKIKYTSATASDMADPEYKYNFLTELNIDLLFAKISGSMKKYYFLEIFESSLPRNAIRKKIRNYFDFYFSDSWEDTTGEDFPTFLFVFPTLSMLIYTKRFAKKLLKDSAEIDLKLQFAQEKEVKKFNILGEIWE